MPSTKFPEWLKRKLPAAGEYNETLKLIRKHRLHTVCDSARCPNMSECFSKKTATFLIMGNVCTRRCLFCDIKCGIPLELDLQEPGRILAAVKTLGLKYVVITSVTRDDLSDGGAGHFASVIKALKTVPNLKIELLIPDFQNNDAALQTVLKAGPDVIAHNMEMVKELYPVLRPVRSDFKRSLKVLKNLKKLDKDCVSKTGFMAGLGETRTQISSLLDDIVEVGCDILTVGQYLMPSKDRAVVKRFLTPEEFIEIKLEALEKGLKSVYSGPFVRSSYNAEEVFHKINNADNR